MAENIGGIKHWRIQLFSLFRGKTFGDWPNQWCSSTEAHEALALPYHQSLWPHHQYFNLSCELATYYQFVQNYRLAN